jgi:hypothetical protein
LQQRVGGERLRVAELGSKRAAHSLSRTGVPDTKDFAFDSTKCTELIEAKAPFQEL